MLGETLHGYEIKEHIGQGGQGAVYRAFEPSVRRQVAIKVILPEYANNPVFKQRFETEARLIAQLEHPHIIPLYHYWHDETGAFLVMRFVEGGSLRTRIEKIGMLSLQQTGQLLSQMTDALFTAHQAGVVHRDLKPENILLDEQGNVYLSDFGIAKILDSDLQITSTDHVIDSPAYLTPEQIRGEPVSPQTDIYSLGIMLYEMLTGEHPFGQAGLMFISKHLHDAIPTVHHSHPHLPHSIDQVIQKATRKEPTERYASARELAVAFHQAIEVPQPVVVTPNDTQGTVIGVAKPQTFSPVDITEFQPVLPKTIEEKNRLRMIQKVRAFWIKGVLENSLHNAVLLALGMAYKPDAVDYPWEMVLQQPEHDSQALPPGTRVLQVFQEVNGELLILGKPGSGKTTTLLELARDLLHRAERDRSLPIPVIFNLSSWAAKALPLETWLVEELHDKYEIPHKVAQTWVEDEAILPLLDGLDEVNPESQNACVEAINAYRSEHGFTGMVVCSRNADYEALTKRLRLQSAIVLQPLDLEQVKSYLLRFGDELEAVRQVLEDDLKLQELVKSPLMLNVVMLAYQDIELADLPQFDTLEGRRDHLFETYVDRMLQRRGKTSRYAPEQTKHYLAWLAGQMSQQMLSVFHIESLQPSWLLGRLSQWQYAIGFRLFVTFLFLFVTSFGLTLVGYLTWLAITSVPSLLGLPASGIPARDIFINAGSAILFGAFVSVAFLLSSIVAEKFHVIVTSIVSPIISSVLVALLVSLGENPSVRDILLVIAYLMILFCPPVLPAVLVGNSSVSQRELRYAEVLNWSSRRVCPTRLDRHQNQSINWI